MRDIVVAGQYEEWDSLDRGGGAGALVGHSIGEITEELTRRPIGLAERELLIKQPRHGNRKVPRAAVHALCDRHHGLDQHCGITDLTALPRRSGRRTHGILGQRTRKGDIGTSLLMDQAVPREETFESRSMPLAVPLLKASVGTDHMGHLNPLTPKQRLESPALVPAVDGQREDCHHASSSGSIDGLPYQELDGTNRK
ncbi:hypothetical protein ACIBCB_19490 [Streptomyces uncialis]|uniref:hypothetical protein n=1 Tax=Streptomyces uncialis TaxID=1048205 RepID=UPI00379D950B